MPRTIIGYKLRKTKNNLKLLQGGEKIFICPCGYNFYVSVGRFHESTEILDMDQNRLKNCRGRFGEIDTHKIYSELDENGKCPMCPKPKRRRRRRRRRRRNRKNKQQKETLAPLTVEEKLQMSLDNIIEHNKKIETQNAQNVQTFEIEEPAIDCYDCTGDIVWVQNPVFGAVLPTVEIESTDSTFEPTNDSTEDVLEYYSDYYDYPEEYSEFENSRERYYYVLEKLDEDAEYAVDSFEDDYVEFTPLTTEEKMQMSLDDIIEYNKQAGYELLEDSSEEYFFVKEHDDKGKEEFDSFDEEIAVQVESESQDYEVDNDKLNELWIEMKEMTREWKLNYEDEKVIQSNITSNLLSNVLTSKL